MSVKEIKKINILFITEFLPWPLNSGGRIRSYNIMMELVKYHQVTLVANDYDNVKDIFKNKVFKLYVARSKKKPKLIRLLEAFFAIFTDKPYLSVFKHYNRRMAKTIQKIIKHEKFDLVHLDHLDASVYLKYCGGCSTYLDEHNYETDLLNSVLSSTPNLAIRYFLKNQHKKLKNYENLILKSVDVVGTVSENDANRIMEIAPHTRVMVIPNGVDLDFFNINRSPEKNRIVAIGSLDWQPNEEGLIWFIDNVWPRILTRINNPTLQIVGRNPSSRLLKKSNSSIDIFGSVPDVRVYASKAAVFIVPLFSGGGTRLKVLEAMAMGIPIVSTEKGAEGIDYDNGDNILIARTVEEFAAGVVTICNNESFAKSISANATVLVTNKYAWPSIGFRLNTCYEKSLGN